MKKREISFLLATVSMVCAAALSAWGTGGSLTPPGAPEPTMKTLDQVEPRIPLGSGSTNITIETGGSYYLTGNIDGGIAIGTDNVTLDLMGYSIQAVDDGIDFAWGTERYNLRIHNGIISAPSGCGINFASSSATANGVIENITFGYCSGYGLAIGGGYSVRNCRIEGGGAAAGISVDGNSRIEDCTITGCQIGLKMTGTGAYIANNIVKGNTDNYALSTGNQLNILLCEVPESLDWPCSVTFAGTLVCTDTASNGIAVNADNVTIDLAGNALIGPGTSGRSGIRQASEYKNLTVMNGKITDWRATSAYGLLSYGYNSRIENIQLDNNYYGVYVQSNSVVRSCAAGNGVYGFRAVGDVLFEDCKANDCTFGFHSSDGAAFINCQAANNSQGFYGMDQNTYVNCSASQNTTCGIIAEDDNTLENCKAYKNGKGIDVNSGVLKNCTATYNTGDGFVVDDDSLLIDCEASNNENGFTVRSDNKLENCIASDNNNIGFQLDSRNSLLNCQANGNDAAGVNIGGYFGEHGLHNRIVGNSVMNNNWGIYMVDRGSTGNYLADNIVRGNANNNFTFTTGNQLNLLLCEVPEVLKWPCSVTFAGTLTCTNTTTNGITVASDNVTIDMAGHALIGPGASSKHGIEQPAGYNNLTVMNGSISQWKGDVCVGLYARGCNALLENILASANHNGIFVMSNAVVHSCVATTNLHRGIEVVYGSSVENCVACQNGDIGIWLGYGNIIDDCTARENGGTGIYAREGNKIQNCTAHKNPVGFGLYFDNMLEHCHAYLNRDGSAGSGIETTSYGNRIDSNNLTDNYIGINVTGSGNFIVRNSCTRNTTNYSIAANNDAGTIQTSPVGAGAWDNFTY